MSQVKTSFANSIRATFAATRFTKDDFEIELPKSGSTLVRIVFAHKPEYELSLIERTKVDNVTVKGRFDLVQRTESTKQTIFAVRAIPGDYKRIEETEISSPGDFPGYIHEWCENIRDDLYALAPQIDPIETLRQQVQANLEEMVENPASVFTTEETQAVDARLDRLLEEIEALKESHSLSQQQLDQLRREFEEFKQSARIYPRGIWAKITSNKMVRSVGGMLNSAEGRKFIFQQITRALGGG